MFFSVYESVMAHELTLFAGINVVPSCVQLDS